jgi:glyoxylase-like metal-dependent hydrolase (beta-lactamase superfamily II)
MCVVLIAVAHGVATTSRWPTRSAAESASHCPGPDALPAGGDLRRRVAIPTDGDVEIIQFQRRAKGCLGYLVGDPATDQAAAIDVPRHTEQFHATARERGYDITHVFGTHVHADHIAGGRHLAADVGATYHLPERAAERDVGYDYHALAPNEVVQVGEVEIKAVATPGHTAESTSYLVGTAAVVTGDTLFVDSVGRTELQFGDSEAATGASMLYESLHRTLLAEPDALSVLPGHFALAPDGTTDAPVGEPIVRTLGDLRTGLDLLRADEAAFVDRVAEDVPAKPPNYETVIAINTGQRSVDTDQEAIELELGPNNCAVSSD